MRLNLEFPSGITYLALSPEGTHLAVASEELPSEVLVVALPSGKTLSRYTGLAERPWMHFYSESNLLVVHGHTCQLCDVANGTSRNLSFGETPYGSYLTCCEISPDGRTAAVGGAVGAVLLLDLLGEKEPRPLGVPGHYVERITWSPDGRLLTVVLATRDEYRVFRLIAILDAQSGKEVRLMMFPEVQFYEYPNAVHPNNRLLATAYRSKVLLYEVDPPMSPLDPEALFDRVDWHGVGFARPVACYPLESREEVTDLWFSREGIVLKILQGDGLATLMATDEGTLLQKTPGPAEVRWGVAISASGRAVGRVDEQTVLLWDVPGWGEA